MGVDVVESLFVRLGSGSDIQVEDHRIAPPKTLTAHEHC